MQQVEDFWFGAEEEPNWDRNQKPGPWMKKWFSGGPETDKYIKAKFKSTIEAIENGKFENWK